MKTMRVLLDTNIWIDYYLSREPFCNEAKQLIGLLI